MRAADGRGLRRLLALVAAALVMSAARAEELRPFEVAYNWSYKGLTVAYSTLSLVRRDSETWVYTSHSEPRGLGRLLSYHPKMESVMRVTDAAGVQPLSYNGTAGTSSTKRDIHVIFDWDHGRVTGIYEDSKLDQPLEPGTHDDLSIQIALMYELLRGRAPERFLLLDKTETRGYHYTRERQETLDTALGSISTIVYKSVKENSPRITRFWCAPDRGFLPMRVQQTRDNNVEWTMQIQSARRY
jgi:hypothetical protein